MHAQPLPSPRGRTLHRLLTQMGQTADLRVCLDAGDGASYAGSGDKWLDTSSGGHDFFRGGSDTGATDNPTFNGSSGGLSSSEYWGFDGGDFFTLDQSNPSWVNDLHKANAAFSMIAWFYSKSSISSGNQIFFSTFATLGTDTGVRVFSGPPQTINCAVRASGNLVLGIGSSGEAALIPDDAWSFIGFSLNEAGGAARYQINGAQYVETGDATYNAPSTGTASQTMTIGNSGIGGTQFFESGTRMAVEAIWSRALTPNQMNAVFEATRGRFGV